MRETESREVWIGLAEVTQRPGAGLLTDRNEAMVNVLAYSRNAPDFVDQIRIALDGLGFDLVDLEDPEPLRVRVAEYEVQSDLLALADEVQRDGGVRFGSFHTWVSNDESNGES